jgi:hypothetical protein
MLFVIGFYELDLGYGGPEEGGWWFESGTLVRLHRVMRDEAAAHAYAARQPAA